MARATIDQLIINSPYDEPAKHWRYDRATRLFDLAPGRRPAGYVIPSPDSRAYDDPGIMSEIPLVNSIRPRVKAWRDADYPGASTVTRRLLRHWNDPEEFDSRRFFFCQLEAVETLVWLHEAPAADRVGIDVPSDGGSIPRFCAKMATGTGKTVVMAMVIAWQVLNKAAYPRDRRFSRNVLVVAPGLTVKSRLAVLDPSQPGNYYRQFRIVPSALLDKLRRGRIVVHNWHALGYETSLQVSKRRSVDKRGALSDEAYVRTVLGGMAAARDILVINDEAHHAWRMSEQSQNSNFAKADLETATKWIEGLDRIHRTRRILRCYDFSATPFVPSGGKSSGEALFAWIVSDFGLNDAIEAGLVKTPRVVVRDDAVPNTKTWKSRFYHIYSDPEVKDNLNRKASPTEALPDLVLNAYDLLGYDWRETAQEWERLGAPTPPAMITVANRTETAARVRHAFTQGSIHIEELCDTNRILHIDSKSLAKAEAAEEPIATVDKIVTEAAQGTPRGRGRRLNAKQQAELLRRQVDTVGQVGGPGEQIQNVISVGMLSEGWDAKTVTHIMGLRAFASQLLCEQVVGRGLRRTAYDVNSTTGLLEPEYVNIFGVPFTFLPHESETGVPAPPLPKTAIKPVTEKQKFEITWPNVVRIDRVLKPRLTVDWDKTERLILVAEQTARIAELAPIVDGKPDMTRIAAINLQKLAQEFRMQRIAFETAQKAYDELQPDWRGNRIVLVAQLVRLTEQFLRSDRVVIKPKSFATDVLKRRLMLTLNMTKAVRQVLQSIRFENAQLLVPIFDRDRPIRSTGDMVPWYTGKPCEHAVRSHINLCVFDSTWEATTAYALDHHPAVEAWVKNDHLGFEVLYIHNGVIHKYRPDFLIRLMGGEMLVLEVKGRSRPSDLTKRKYLQDWVAAVNSHGGFGHWSCAVSSTASEIHDILDARVG